MAGLWSRLRASRKNIEYYRRYSKEYNSNPEYKQRKSEESKIRRQMRGTNKSVCTILKEHHKDMKDDPEHLTTDFIKKLIKADCKDI